MIARMPPALCSNAIRRIALQDILIRIVDESRQMICQGNRGIGHSGLVSIDVGGQEVLERTAMVVTESWIETRMQVGLPARGRTILGRQAEAILCQELPRLVQNESGVGRPGPKANTHVCGLCGQPGGYPHAT